MKVDAVHYTQTGYWIEHFSTQRHKIYRESDQNEKLA